VAAAPKARQTVGAKLLPRRLAVVILPDDFGCIARMTVEKRLSTAMNRKSAH
jgi:hypothetical protein